MKLNSLRKKKKLILTLNYRLEKKKEKRHGRLLIRSSFSVSPSPTFLSHHSISTLIPRHFSKSECNQPTMTSSESNAADHVVELIVHDASQPPPPPPPSSSDDSRDNVDAQIAPLLSHTDRPKINIFTASYPRRKPRVFFISFHFYY